MTMDKDHKPETPRQLPSAIRLADGAMYKPTAFRIVDWDDYGRPMTCQMIPEDVPIELMSGDRFLIAFVDQSILTGEKSCDLEPS